MQYDTTPTSPLLPLNILQYTESAANEITEILPRGILKDILRYTDGYIDRYTERY